MLSTNASQEDEIVFFPPQGITSSASRLENILKKFSLSIIFDWKKELIFLLQHAAFENGHT